MSTEPKEQESDLDKALNTLDQYNVAYRMSDIKILLRRELEALITKRENIAKLNTLKDVYTAIDGEAANKEYVFNLQNAIEDKIFTLEAELKKGLDTNHE